MRSLSAEDEMIDVGGVLTTPTFGRLRLRQVRELGLGGITVINVGPELTALASAVDSALGELQIPREERPYSPHLTLARAGGGS